MVSMEKDERVAFRARTFEDFLGLVQEYHTAERSLGFYAGRLGLPPKYLSKLVRSVSGRTAGSWIDSYVTEAAKNLLKYSEQPVASVAAQLNFSNETTFYRFFKAQTGMTPTEYRRG